MTPYEIVTILSEWQSSNDLSSIFVIPWGIESVVNCNDNVWFRSLDKVSLFKIDDLFIAAALSSLDILLISLM